MYISTRTFVTVLLATLAHDASAAPHKRQEGAIPPEVLASQASSAAAAASSAAAANEAAASGGLRPLPGVQADEGAPVSLRPLPGLEGAGNVVAPPPVIAEPTAVVEAIVTPTEAAVVVPTSVESLRQLPGLNTEVAAAPSLAPLPSVATEVAAVESEAPAPVLIGTFSQIVAEETTSAAEIVETSIAAPVIVETSAAPEVVLPPVPSAPASIGSFSVIGADLLAAPATTTAESAAAEPTLAVPVLDAIAETTTGNAATASVGFFTPIQIASSAAATDLVAPVLTFPTLNQPIPIPTTGLVFTNTTVLGGVATGGVASPTGNLKPLPGLDGNGAAAGTLQPLPGVAGATGSLRPLPGVAGASGGLSPLPTDSSSETLLVDGSVTTSADGSAATDGVESVLTTLTTVDSNGQATTLVTAVAVTSSALDSEPTAAGAAPNNRTNNLVTAGASSAFEGKSLASLMSVLGGVVAVVLLL
ncbi:hypothetical protein QBC38DRAFT_85162 [Podospora fimiseda]|uniref:Uncharacterized protein n=1 Tax=Podospora fimiseda TaxID=252190 RepID=A0AAN7BUT2_9PEZI|nr:hypothetical protein QBC38DRAFT_85162 [Podospora fimiseda]